MVTATGAIRAGMVPGAQAGAREMAGRRAALWALLAAKAVAGWGVQWDIQWHVLIGRDSFWIAPHLMTYGGVSAIVLLSFALLGRDAMQAARGVVVPGAVRILGLASTRGVHLAAWGIMLTVLAAPIDDAWHRLFGLDVTLWSPPHLLGLLGSVVNSLACLLLAQEVYPGATVARLAALAVAGAQVYGGLHFAVEPTGRLAYLHGGLAFHSYAMLASLLVPLALVTTAAVSRLRWAPVLVILVAMASGTAGTHIARFGFDVLRPVSVITEEIERDPTSPIAVANIIARKNGTPPGRAGGAWSLVALLPALAMVAVDARRHPVTATAAWAAVLFTVVALRLASLPAFAPMVPTAGTTAVALMMTLGAAALAGTAAAALSRALAHPPR
jgi:hypothetical protein